MKISFFDKRILKNSFNFAMIIGTIIGIVAVFFNDMIINNKILILLFYILLIIVYYICSIINANIMKKVTLNIHGSTFEIKEGDIFEQKSLKVINFNEYFDTTVDNRIIAENSLNGQFIKNYVSDLSNLDKRIETELKEIEINSKRVSGKQKRYELGTIIEYNGFLLTALTKFDDRNMANLNLKEFLTFLMSFWDNLNSIYANRNVAITLFGSGSLTRFTDAYDINEQELLEIILWTFKISKIKFKYPTQISMILSKNLLSKINLYDMKERC